MLLDLLAAASAALAAAGLLLLGFRLAGRRAPRWLAPVAAALGVVAVTAALRYQWAPRMEGLLPPDMVVLDRVQGRSPFDPLSYLWPVTDALLLADTASRRHHPGHPGLVLLDLVLLRRGEETLLARHLVECGAARDAVVPPGWDGGDPAALAWATTTIPGLQAIACAVSTAPAAEPAAGGPAAAGPAL